MSGFFMQRIDERSLVAADKPDLTESPRGYLNNVAHGVRGRIG
jgi:hypothetical protein